MLFALEYNLSFSNDLKLNGKDVDNTYKLLWYLVMDRVYLNLDFRVSEMSQKMDFKACSSFEKSSMNLAKIQEKPVFNLP